MNERTRMQIPFYYVIWCDSLLSRDNNDKIEYFVFKGKYKAISFFKHFKKLKELRGINKEYQHIDQYKNFSKYRCAFEDGFITYELNLGVEEKYLIAEVLARFEPLDGSNRSHQDIIAIINGKKKYKRINE